MTSKTLRSSMTAQVFPFPETGGYLVWNLETGAIQRIIEGHEKDVLSVVYSDGCVYTSGDDMTLRVWDLDTGELIKMWGPFENETDSCAIDSQHGRAVLGCDDGVIRVFDISSSETLD